MPQADNVAGSAMTFMLVLRYQSHCKMCDVVKGIIRGLGERCDETFHIKPRFRS